ncbi:MAG TPA: DEAD/DEAH box helicase [Candidatus Hydrogenedentes bacterium]|nr:DEAD/DEAH box helicase [Candidatus Hydrogenedentota bacterium]
MTKKIFREKLKQPHVPRTPRTKKPESMSLEEWQIALRREYGREQSFKVKNLASAPVFSEFAVTNPKSGRTYRVAIRGKELGINFCSCPDFSVNTLGTCKHIEWLLNKLERKRGGKAALSAGYFAPYSEVFLWYGVQRKVCFRAGLDCPKNLLALANQYFDGNGVLRPGAVSKFERFMRDAQSFDHELRVYGDALEYIARLRDDARRREAITRIFEGPEAAREFKSLVKTKLYPYQQKGALFAAKAGRCLIADDMGLGKTIQSITAVEILAKTAGIERVLVICPTALKHQWKQEIERFTERDAMVVEGFVRDRHKRYQAESFYKITNYETVHLDLGLIQGWRPDVVILDEAQRIKNWETRRAKCVKQINATYALVLTGTPLENRLAELHSIMEFVDKFHLGPLFRFLHKHQHTDTQGRIIGYRDLDRIKESLAEVLVRRKKQDVLLELPSRTDKHFFVDMTDAQRKIHEEYRDIVGDIVSKWKRRGFLTEQEQRRLMMALQCMRMSCNSTYLLDRLTEHGPKIDECAALLNDILETPENKVVVFSQWLGTHELLMRRLNGKTALCGFYHGSLDSKKRKTVIDRFKSDPACRVLLCTDSGGVGLNLQVASSLINMDQPWNPAVLEQRIGRIHRLGQHQNVQVYHFVSRGTIEHGMLDVIKFKTAMFEGVLDGGEAEVFLGGSKMKKFMETVESVAGSIPRHVPTQEETQEPLPAETAGQPEIAEEIAELVPTDPETAPSPIPADWKELLSAGIELLGQLSLAGAGSSTPGLGAVITQDTQTGTHELRIPLPDANTAARIGNFLAGLGGLIKNIGERR